MIKYTQEVIPWTFDFSNHPVILSGDTLSASGTVLVITPDTALASTSISINVPLAQVSVTLIGGNAYTAYEVRCSQPTTLGYVATERVDIDVL